MSVNTYLLPISEDELTAILAVPERVRTLVEKRDPEVCSLSYNGPALMFVMAEGPDDPVLFMERGAPPGLSDWIGRYVVKEGRVTECEVDMGYGPAAYFRNSFIADMARHLEPWTVERFSERCDLDELEAQCLYPMGWRDNGRREELIHSFEVFKACITSAGRSGRHLLFWSA